jgi:hypothetical protein
MESLSIELASFLGGALSAAGLVTLIYFVIFSARIKIYRDRVNELGFMAEQAKDNAKKHQSEYDDMRAMYTISSARNNALKKVNEDLREQVRIQAEKSINYKLENESLKSNAPQYKRRDKSADADKLKVESKPSNRGKNIRGADGKWVKNIGQVVEKKIPLTLGF